MCQEANSGAITTFSAGLTSPLELVWSTVTGVLYVTGGDGRVVAINPAATRAVIATGLSQPYGIALDESNSNKHLYVAEGGVRQLVRLSLDGSDTLLHMDTDIAPSGDDSGLQYPQGLAYDTANKAVLVANLLANRVRRSLVSTAGNAIAPAVYLDGLATPRGVARDANSGRVFVTSGFFNEGVQIAPGLITEVIQLGQL